MQQILRFLIRNKNTLLALVLFILSLGFTIQSHTYHKTHFINSANALTGGVYTIFNNLAQYKDLKQQNKKLVLENKKLKKRIFNHKEKPIIDTLLIEKYDVLSAKIIKNSYKKINNYLLLNKGEIDSISQDMGVISSHGIVGIVERTSTRFATVQSILNTKSKINAKLKNTNHFGTLSWNRERNNTVQLLDIPRLATPKKGDTIVTGGMSTIFPEGIAIGTISSYALDISENYYLIDVALFNDMTSLQHVYLVKNLHKKEIDALENKSIHE